MPNNNKKQKIVFFYYYLETNLRIETKTIPLFISLLENLFVTSDENRNKQK